MGTGRDGDLRQPFFYLLHTDSFAYGHDSFDFLQDAFLDNLRDNLLFPVF
jgi:hypothetical protein